MRILITGQRTFAARALMLEVFKGFPKDAIIIEGEAKGADIMAREIGESLGMVVKKFPAKWTKYGKAAGVIRNTQMLDEGKPTVVHAFFEKKTMDKSRGTKNMIKQAKDRGIPVQVHIAHSLGAQGQLL